MSDTSGGPESSPAYPVGTVINGRVWTGSVWAPVVVPASPQGASVAPKPKSRRGTWFRPWWVVSGWLAFFVIVLVLGFIPNQTLQTAVSIVWIVGLPVGGIGTLVALVLWLGGVGAKSASDEPVE